MPYKKILIIIITIGLIIAGVMAVSALFPRPEPKKIDPPVDVNQTQQAFNNLTKDVQTNLNPDNLGNILNSSSSSRSAFTQINQAITKNIDPDTVLFKIQSQDLPNLTNEFRVSDNGRQVLMFLDPQIATPDNFYYLKIKDETKYVGQGIETVEKLNINDQTYYLIIQTDIYKIPKVAIFNNDFSFKKEIPIFIQENNSTQAQDRVYLLFDSIKSISNSNLILRVKNGNTPSSTLSDFNIELKQYTNLDPNAYSF